MQMFFFAAMVAMASAAGFGYQTQNSYKPVHQVHHQPVYKHPEPVYKHIEPVYKHPEPVYKHPEPVHKPHPNHYNPHPQPHYGYKVEPCKNKPDGDYVLDGEFAHKYSYADKVCSFVKCANGFSFLTKCGLGTRNDEYGRGPLKDGKLWLCDIQDHYGRCGKPYPSH